MLAVLEALAIAGLSLQVYQTHRQIELLEEARALDGEYRRLALRYVAVHERASVACSVSLARLLDRMGVREGPAVEMTAAMIGRPAVILGVGGE